MKKIFHIFFTIWGVVTAIFFLFHVLPGDPARMLLDQNENSEQLFAIKHKYGFDKPVWVQYFYYLNNISPISIHSKNSADFSFFSQEKYDGISLFSTEKKWIVIKIPYLGESFQKNGKKVTQIIGETLPNTLILSLSAIFFATIVGIFLGIISALNKNKWIDIFIQLISTLGMSLPSFFSAIILAWIFGFLLHQYTHLEMIGNLYEIDDFGNDNQLKIKNLILPTIALGIRPLAVVSQLMRNSLLDVFSQDYIRTAYAKGLSTWQIILKHALKNALNPVITVLSSWFAGMLAGSVFIETIFGWNGIGKEIVDALTTLDLPVVMGSILTISIIFVLMTLLVDVLYRWLDPRV